MISHCMCLIQHRGKILVQSCLWGIKIRVIIPDGFEPGESEYTNISKLTRTHFIAIAAVKTNTDVSCQGSQHQSHSITTERVVWYRIVS